MEDLERFLSLVGRELDAHDVHLRLGGKDPVDPRTVFIELEPAVRLVVQFSARPAEPARIRDRLVALARTFDTTVQHATKSTRHVGTTRATSDIELNHALDVLADRTDAAAILIVDERSPVLWGHSADEAPWHDAARHALVETSKAPPLDEDETPALPDVSMFDVPRDLDELVSDAVLVARTVTSNRLLRGREGGIAVRCFGGIYRLVIAFAHGFSPLHVETSVSKALPAIERLVEGLPPVDPSPSRATVTRLHPR